MSVFLSLNLLRNLGLVIAIIVLPVLAHDEQIGH
jgi:hypothetical protein